MLTRWNPFEDIARLQEDAFRPDAWRRGEYALRPAVDIHEQEGAITVNAELPGIRPEDVNVEVREGVLTITGERKLEHEDKREGYHRVERAYGSFTRSFQLPDTVDTESIEANMNNGVLTVKLPKRAETQPHRIPVRSQEGEQQSEQQEELRA